MRTRPLPTHAPLAVAAAAALAATLAAGAAEARITKGPWVQRLGPTSAVIRVELDPPAPVSLEIGAASPEGGARRTLEEKEARSLHSVPVAGLDPATRYPYTVRASGEATSGAFTTAPRDDSKEPYKFLVYGDNRTDDAAHAAIVKAMLQTPADFLVHTGDFVEDGGSAHDWQAFFDIEAPLIRERCVFACVGNHELTDRSGIAFARYFAPGDAPAGLEARAIDPKYLAGTFRWQSARFFLVNGMVPYRSGPDRTWLERALAAADDEPGVEWRIVVLHHGPWSSGPHGDNLYLHDANVPQLLRSHKVDLVLSGHDHIYERGAVDGLAYLVSGGGGAPPYRVRDLKPYAKKLESTRHFVQASVDADGIAMRAVRADGSVIERCALKKKLGWECDARRAPPEVGPKPVGSGAALPPPAGGDVTKKSSCACDVVGGARARGPGAGAAVAIAVGLALRATRRTTRRTTHRRRAS